MVSTRIHVRTSIVVLLLFLAGCGGQTPVHSGVSISDTTDTDCDGAVSEFIASATIQADSLNSNVRMRLKYLDTGGEYRNLAKLGVGTQQIQYTGNDIPVDGETRLRVTVEKNGLFSNQVLSRSTSRRFEVEDVDADAPKIEPTFEYGPNPAQRSAPVTFSASDAAEDGCNVDQYLWDFDDDNEQEREGRNVTFNFSNDGTHSVSLVIRTEKGTSRRVTKDVLVMFDPDGDGITKSRELQMGTDPRDPDTDGDLFPDGVDPVPLSIFVPTVMIQIIVASLLFGILLWNRVSFSP